MWLLLALLLAAPATAQVQPDVETLSMSVTVVPPVQEAGPGVERRYTELTSPTSGYTFTHICSEPLATPTHGSNFPGGPTSGLTTWQNGMTADDSPTGSECFKQRDGGFVHGVSGGQLYADPGSTGTGKFTPLLGAAEASYLPYADLTKIPYVLARQQNYFTGSVYSASPIDWLDKPNQTTCIRVYRRWPNPGSTVMTCYGGPYADTPCNAVGQCGYDVNGQPFQCGQHAQHKILTGPNDACFRDPTGVANYCPTDEKTFTWVAQWATEITNSLRTYYPQWRWQNSIDHKEGKPTPESYWHTPWPHEKGKTNWTRYESCYDHFADGSMSARGFAALLRNSTDPGTGPVLDDVGVGSTRNPKPPADKGRCLIGNCNQGTNNGGLCSTSAECPGGGTCQWSTSCNDDAFCAAQNRGTCHIPKVLTDNISRPGDGGGSMMWRQYIVPELGVDDRMSHYMQLTKSGVDTNFWIGPACEMEGRNGVPGCP